MRKGADNYLAKPFTEDELVQAIEESYATRSHTNTKQK